jgi:hypothetical protein
VLAPAAARSVLELGGAFHQLVRFFSSFSGRFLLFFKLLFAAWQPLPLWFRWPR